LHLKASEFEAHKDIDAQSEPWRSALEKELSAYVKIHYKDVGCSVFGSSDQGQVTLVCCTEAHKFQPANFWYIFKSKFQLVLNFEFCFKKNRNARWRARWAVSFQPASSRGGEVELNGEMKAQVHYYEDGNVQLVSQKEIKETVRIGETEETAKAIIEAIERAENEYQSAISENYQTMSETTFKALRRALPVTRSKLDWNKISSYKIGNELKSTSPATP
jgi:capping protein alpha